MPQPHEDDLPHNAFFQSVDDVVSAGSDPNPAAKAIVATITDSPQPAEALYQFWTTFFTSTSLSSDPSYTAPLSLLSALRSQDPTIPSSASLAEDSDASEALRPHLTANNQLDWSRLPYFTWQWRDTHDSLQANRERTSPLKNGVTPSAQHENFCAFSAQMLAQSREENDPLTIWVFHAAKQVLESKSAPAGPPGEGERLSPEQTRALDLRVAARWIRDGGRKLWEADGEVLARDWKRALEAKTELWRSGEGLTADRWALWRDVLGEVLDGEDLDGETKGLVKGAKDVIDGLLDE